MYELKPYMEIKGNLFTYYFRKADKKLLPSRRIIANIDGEGIRSYCREILISRIKDNIIGSSYNKVVPSNPYVLKYHTKFKGNTTLYGNSTITIYMGSLKALETLNKEVKDKTFKDLILYTLGIISTCLHGGSDEKDRQSHLDKEMITCQREGCDYKVDINFLSSYWLVHPVLTSLILGLARQPVSYLRYWDRFKTQCMELLKSIERSKVVSIIKNGNQKEARNIYQKYLLPFYNSVPDADNFTMFKDKHKVAISKLIEEGYDSVFNPENIVNNWYKYSCYYGFDRFSNYITNPYSKLGYKNYR